ncbi:MAG: helix-turn-helix transcriptional regulator [Acidimicrobiaceae bacterium]|nr:helix-turn-helix transcriptional regulator [Acidimicrobiaceae bacterium]
MTDDAIAEPSHAPPESSATEHRRSIDVYTADGIGAAVAQLRRAAGLSQSQFGKMVGASRPWVSNLERGNLRGGQLDTVLACIHALGYRIVLADAESKPSALDELKNAMRLGPLAHSHADLAAAIANADDRIPPR